MATVICGQCTTKFEAEVEADALAAELEHICSVTGFAPTDPRSMGEDYEAIQAAALSRGVERIDEEVHPAEAVEIAEAPATEVTPETPAASTDSTIK